MFGMYPFPGKVNRFFREKDVALDYSRRFVFLGSLSRTPRISQLSYLILYFSSVSLSFPNVTLPRLNSTERHQTAGDANTQNGCEDDI